MVDEKEQDWPYTYDGTSSVADMISGSARTQSEKSAVCLSFIVQLIEPLEGDLHVHLSRENAIADSPTATARS
jgi:hypothetical protein